MSALPPHQRDSEVVMRGFTIGEVGEIEYGPDGKTTFINWTMDAIPGLEKSWYYCAGVAYPELREWGGPESHPSDLTVRDLREMVEKKRRHGLVPVPSQEKDG